MNRRLSVALLPALLSPSLDQRRCCSIVIDVLRATSVMTTAAAAGVRQIITCGDIDRARKLAADDLNRPLLCGERSCKPIQGFDLGNSPAEYSASRVGGKDMILTTTNGTRAIEAVMPSRRLLVGSFLNFQATLNAVAQESEILVVCAGTNGEISSEDVLLAGAIVDRLVAMNSVTTTDDSARLARDTWRQAQARDRGLAQTLRRSLGGRNLSAVGFEADIDRCAQLDLLDVVVERSDSSRPVFQCR